MLDNISSFNETLHIDLCGTKHKLTDEMFAYLCRKQLSHIHKQRIEGLMSNGILDHLDF